MVVRALSHPSQSSPSLSLSQSLFFYLYNCVFITRYFPFIFQRQHKIFSLSFLPLFPKKQTPLLFFSLVSLSYFTLTDTAQSKMNNNNNNMNVNLSSSSSSSNSINMDHSAWLGFSLSNNNLQTSSTSDPESSHICLFEAFTTAATATTASGM